MRGVLFVALVLMSIASYGQDDSQKKQTKFEQLASKTGSILKFVDISMPRIGNLETSVRTVLGEQKNKYFYRIEKLETSNSNSKIAMIEYSDLVEINKALTKLLSEEKTDSESNPDYLENKYITEDGFSIGYYIEKGIPNWFVRLERYGKSTVFVKKETIAENLPAAQKKIEELKSINGK